MSMRVNTKKLNLPTSYKDLYKRVHIADPCGEVENANNVIRITGDNVFTSTEYLEGQISIHNEQDLDYTRIIGVPLGTTAEVIKFSALKKGVKRLLCIWMKQ
ncbi:MAG TPA: hypothetical protein EYQ12_08385 [Oceanospirillaceae bacterium]|nr:hypothetical protein [Oceanospirillaceae bacterium]